ncbi:MAG: OFA family MFS transporter, partial [Bacillota bacterium]|nr:OFA family MFS transporter [Bacillota bacterium]
YSWGVFASALRAEGWTSTQSQIPYMIACAVFAILMVPGGRMQDRFGPKLVLLIASIMTAIGFIFSGLFKTVGGLSIFFGIFFGIAMGFGYATTTPTAIKWFGKEHRGLISGIVVSGFGLAGIYIAPLTNRLIHQFGLDKTFIILGLFFSAIILLFRLFIANPPDGFRPALSGVKPGLKPDDKPATTSQPAASDHPARDYTWRQMMHTSQFYLLWVMFLLGTFAGLLILGQLSTIGQEQAGLSPSIAMSLVMIYAVFNWLGRILTGLISDKIGRRATLLSIFLIQVLSFLFFPQMTTYLPLAIGTAFVAFSFGGMLTNFPAVTADYFGVKNLGLNYGLVFTAWGGGGVFGPFLGGLVHDLTGAYLVSYHVSAILCFAGALLSLLVRAPRESAAGTGSQIDPVETASGS